MRVRELFVHSSAITLIFASFWVVTPPLTQAATTATPSAGCPMPTGLTIPNATFFAPYGLGGSPMWAVGQGVPPKDLPTAQVAASPIPGVVAAGPTDLGWFLKVLWVIEPAQHSPVSLSGKDPEGNPVLFDINGAGPASGAVLDPAQPAIPIQQGGWAEFPSYVYFPLQGCYTFEAHWSEGSWSFQFPFVPPDPS